MCKDDKRRSHVRAQHADPASGNGKKQSFLDALALLSGGSASVHFRPQVLFIHLTQRAPPAASLASPACAVYALNETWRAIPLCPRA